MAKDVQKPASTNYLTKLTSQASLLIIDISPGFFNISDDTATTIATITKNQDKFYEMTLEEQMQRYDDEHYKYTDAFLKSNSITKIPNRIDTITITNPQSQVYQQKRNFDQKPQTLPI